MDVYISSSAGFKDWDFAAIHQDSEFKLSCPTMRFLSNPRKDSIKMLDWDYREWIKNPDRVETTHLQIVKDNDLDVVMSMDAWDNNIEKCIAYTAELLKHAPRVLIPFHSLDPQLLEFDLSYPNANWFTGNLFPPKEFRERITHILGGTPDSQMYFVSTSQVDLSGMPLRFPAVTSVDGNQIFNIAMSAGKYWHHKKPHWQKPAKMPSINGNNGHAFTTQQIYAMSVKNITDEWRRIDDRFRREGKW